MAEITVTTPNKKTMGTGGADVIFGSTGNDTLYGQAGNDKLYGDTGNDVLYGDSGNDVLEGGEGDDVLYSDAGNDSLTGGDGRDTYYMAAGFGNDTILADTSDTLVFSDSSLKIENLKVSNEGNDLLIGFATNKDTLRLTDWFANDTHQTLNLKIGGTVYNTRTTREQTLTGPGEYTPMIKGTDGNDIIFGTEEGILFDGLLGNDILFAGGGNDTVVYHSSDKYVSGGDGSDWLMETGGNRSMKINLATDKVYVNFENVSATLGNDSIIGTAGDNFLAGVSGNDTLYGMAGNDTLESGSLLDGGEGNDVILARNVANATLFGGNGADILVGGTGNDTLIGGAGNDSLFGGEGSDTYYFAAGSGNDVISDTSGGDVLVIAGNGITYRNLAISQSGSHLILEVAGKDSITIEDWFGKADGNRANKIVIGGNTYVLADTHTTLDGNKLVLGTEYAEAFDAARLVGNDVILAGAGDDTVSYDVKDLYVSGGSGYDVLDASGYTKDMKLNMGTDGKYIGFEKLLGGSGNDSIIGTDGENFISGGAAGKDSLYGGNGSDTLSGDAGADALYGDNGADVLWGGADNDSLTGGSGNDTLSGGAGNDVYRFAAGFGNDVIEADIDSNGADLISLEIPGYTYQKLSFSQSGDDLVLAVTGNDSITLKDWYVSGAAERVRKIAIGGKTYNLSRESGNGALTLVVGGEGNDTFDGFKANDIQFGGSGNDVAVYGTSVGYIDGGTGEDLVDGSQWSKGMNLALGTSTQYIGFEDVRGSSYNDTLGGTGGSNVMFGGAGNDSLSGGNGNDTLYGDEGQDTLLGGNGDDVLFGGEGNNRLDGGEGNDILSTSSGANTLLGGKGNDTYSISGTSDDTIVGGLDNIKDTVLLEDMNFTRMRQGNDLVLTFDKGSLTLSQWYIDSGRITQFVDANSGTAVDLGITFGKTTTGTAKGETLSGTANDDWLIGNGGNDTLNGLGGSDVLDGGAGNDILQGNAGQQVYKFGLGYGNDVIVENGTNHNDTLLFGKGIVSSALQLNKTSDGYVIKVSANDSLTVNGTYQDTMYLQFADGSRFKLILGNEEDNPLDVPNYTAVFGLDGNDQIYGGSLLKGGDGNDSLYTGAEGATLYGGNGADILQGSVGNNFLYGEAGDDFIIDISRGNHYLDGGDGDDSLKGGGGNDTLLGGTGNDSLSHENGNSLLDGGDGNDVLESQYGYETLLGGKGDDTLSHRTGNSLLDGGDGDDVLKSENGMNTLLGGKGDDSLSHQNGSSLLDGGEGNDVLNSQNGDNTLLGGKGDDSLSHKNGNSLLDGGDGDDVLESQYGYDTLLGGKGDDTLSHRTGSSLLDGGDGDDVLKSENGMNTLLGGNGDDSLYHIMSDALLNGGDGNDYLQTDIGNSTLIGGKGNDTYKISSMGDVIIAGGKDNAGDTVILEDADFARMRQGNDLVLTFNQGSLTLSQWYTDSGRITHFIHENTAVNVGTLGKTITGTAKGETVAGTSNDDLLMGNGGNDILYGMGGFDVLDGGAGNDTLQGKDGQQVYQFGLGYGNDVIVENATNHNDIILFGEGISSSDLQLSKTDDGYVIKASDYDSLTVTGTYNDSMYLQFAGGMRKKLILGNEIDNLIEVLNGPAYGLDGNDTLVASGIEELMDGGAGDDSLCGGSGSDTYHFSGTDFGHDRIAFSKTYDVIDVDNLYNISLEEGTSNLILGVQGKGFISETSTITLENWMDARGIQLNLNDGNRYWGKAGKKSMYYFITDGDTETNDIISYAGDSDSEESISNYFYVALGGNDSVLGGLGNDCFWGNQGQDTLAGGGGADELRGGGCNDILNGGSGNDELDGGEGNDILTGGTGVDVYEYGSRWHEVTGNDVITASADNSQDILLVRDLSFMNEAERNGNDLVLYFGNAYTGPGSITLQDWFKGSGYQLHTYQESSTNWEGDPVLTSYSMYAGNDANNSWSGAASKANQIYFGLGGNDVITGGSGINWLYGGSGNDKITGGASNDYLEGGLGKDTLIGGSGNDTLSGGYGNDILTGGAGADVYMIHTELSAPHVTTITGDKTNSQDVVCFTDVSLSVDELALSWSGKDLVITDMRNSSQLLILQNFGTGTGYDPDFLLAGHGPYTITVSGATATWKPMMN